MNIIDTGLSVYRYLYKKVFYPQSTDNQQILEPLTTLVKLALIAFQPVGVKLAISMNRIIIQSPTSVQGAVRWLQGSKKEDLHFLLRPIYRACDLYPPIKGKPIYDLYRLAIEGLRVLKASYERDPDAMIIVQLIELYMDILDSKMTNRSIHLESYKRIKDLNDTVNLSTSTIVNLGNIFKEVWKEDEIDLIIKLLVKMEADKNCYRNAIESIIKAKETHIEDILRRAMMLI
jgi:hypothetical protein